MPRSSCSGYFDLGWRARGAMAEMAQRRRPLSRLFHRTHSHCGDAARDIGCRGVRVPGISISDGAREAQWQKWRSVADLYHAYFTGLILTVVTRRGTSDAAEFVFRVFRSRMARARRNGRNGAASPTSITPISPDSFSLW